MILVLSYLLISNWPVVWPKKNFFFMLSWTIFHKLKYSNHIFVRGTVSTRFFCWLHLCGEFFVLNNTVNGWCTIIWHSKIFRACPFSVTQIIFRPRLSGIVRVELGTLVWTCHGVSVPLGKVRSRVRFRGMCDHPEREGTTSCHEHLLQRR